MTYLKNWRCYSYQIQGDSEKYDYCDLKKYFNINGNDTAECIKDFGIFQRGETVRILEGSEVGQQFLGFLITKSGEEKG